jgi:DNA-directed RNA polymerase specialized sigma24 family protein
VDSYSAKQAEVIFLKLLGFKEREISDRVGITQSSVNIRATNAQWGLMNTAIKDFEALEIEQL